MPIFEYECRACGHQFELIVLKSTVVACPSCQSADLEQLLSGFAVSSESTRQTNLQAARQRYKNSRDLKDRKIAETEDVREHIKDHLPPLRD
jgi:putative FmdB family regulatory protein